MMSHPKLSSAYGDVRETFDLALAHGQALQPFSGSPETIRRAATRWRQRAYSFRATLRAELAKAGRPPETVYENIFCQIVPEGVLVSNQGSGALLPPVPIGPKQADLPESPPDFDSIAKEFGLDLDT